MRRFLNVVKVFTTWVVPWCVSMKGKQMEKVNSAPLGTVISSSESGGSQTLYLTNNRTSQQNLSELQQKRKKYLALENRKIKMSEMRNKKFLPLAQPPSYCNRIEFASIEYKNNKPVKVKFSHIPCKSWRCPVCAPKRVKAVKRLLVDVAILNNLNYFLTLTLDPKTVPMQYKDDTHAYITKIFNHFLTNLKRKKFKYRKNNKTHVFDLKNSNTKIKYVWVMEYQDNGNAHMHLLANIYLPIKKIREMWLHVGGGPQMRVEEVRSIQAAALYISSYLTKGLLPKSKVNTHENLNWTTDKLKDQQVWDRMRNIHTSNFKFFQKRYCISPTCERPQKFKYLPMTKDNGSIDLEKLKSDGLEWVYNKFGKDDYAEEEINL